jgi:hypothetical protein
MKRGYIASIVFAILAVIVFVGVINAHTPQATLECDQIGTPTLTVVLLKYNGNGTNQIRITVDGEVIIETTFIQEYALTVQDLDPFTSHSAFVQVYAWDDPTGSKGFSKEYTLSLEPCQESPTPSPTPEVTPSPTPVPSASPDPTPAPHRTPRPTLPPTDTE